MQYLDGTKEQFQQLAVLPADGPLKMLNLLKFKSSVPSSGKTGAEHYRDYMKAAQPFLVRANGRVVFLGNPQLTMIGPQDLEWDMVLIVEYPTKEDFMKMVTDPDYPSPLRREALEDSRVIYCS